MKTIGPFIIKILVNALNIAETPTPIIINFFVDVDFPQIKKIITTAKKENIKVNIGIYNIDVVKELLLGLVKIVKNTNAPTAPPFDIPNISGDANGFFTTP